MFMMRMKFFTMRKGEYCSLLIFSAKRQSDGSADQTTIKKGNFLRQDDGKVL